MSIEVHTNSYSDYVYVWVNGQTISRTHSPISGRCELNNVTLLLSEGDQISWTDGEVDFACFVPFK